MIAVGYPPNKWQIRSAERTDLDRHRAARAAPPILFFMRQNCNEISDLQSRVNDVRAEQQGLKERLALTVESCAIAEAELWLSLLARTEANRAAKCC